MPAPVPPTPLYLSQSRCISHPGYCTPATSWRIARPPDLMALLALPGPGSPLKLSRWIGSQWCGVRDWKGMPGMLGMIQGAHALTQTPIHWYGHPCTIHIFHTTLRKDTGFSKTALPALSIPTDSGLEALFIYIHTCYLCSLCACSCTKMTI